MTESAVKKGVHIPAPFSLLLLPLLFGAGILSIPYSLIYKLIAKRRRKQLENQMSAKGRLIGWDQFSKAFEAGEGTVIEERYSFKRAQSWWTPDAVRSLSPYPVPDWFEAIKSRRADPFSSWCYAQYTSPETGRALLIARPSAEQRKQSSEIWERNHKSQSERWIDVAPPEILTRS
jgi:hypothetical protein